MNCDAPPLVGICHGPRCADYGGHALSRQLKENGIEPHATPCRSLCTYSPVALVSDRAVLNATLVEVVERLNG